MDSQLQRERTSAPFDVHAMKCLLFQNEDRLASYEKVLRLVESNEAFSKEHEHVLSNRAAVMERNMRKLYETKRLAEEHELDLWECRILRRLAGVNGIALHDDVFVPTLMSMTTPEQFQEWVPKALSHEWIGCYAQTEIAHGSNVRGLLTTATFDVERDEFIVHTPSLDAVKWWPGALGVMSTHAVVYARLITRGEDHGIHNFLVQVRELDTHKPVRGVEVGDIGPKWGTNDNDNGFVRFCNVRIPRAHMLMKFAQVDRDGTYRKSGPSKGSYGTMTRVRAGIVAMSFDSLAAAAVRYGVVRRQEPGADPESPVLNYVTMQHRLLPLIAAAYALRFTGEQMIMDFFELESRASAKDYSMSAMVHAVSCSLKSLCSTITLNGIEECRRACGGHGYLLASGLPKLYVDYMPMFTAEGDNYLLTQQSSRFLLKVVRGETTAPAQFAFLSDPKERSTVSRSCCRATIAGDLCWAPVLLEAMKHRLIHQTDRFAEEVNRLEGRGLDLAAALRDTLVHQYNLSNALGMYSIVTAFYSVIERHEKQLKAALSLLLVLFALREMELHLSDFMLSGFLSKQQAALVAPAVQHVLSLVRPLAVPLTDAFNKSDYVLNSVLGRYDGKYVRALYDSAKHDPLNHGQAERGGDAIAGYDEYLRPFMGKASRRSYSRGAKL